MSKAFVYRTDEGTAFIERWYDEALARWPVPYREHRVETSFGDTYVLQCGTAGAPNLVLMHAGATNSAIWGDWVDLAKLASRYHVYAVDLIGDVGRSTLRRKPANGGIYGPWLVETLDGLQVERTTILGASFGGAVSMLVAHRHPERVERAIAFVPPGVILRPRLRTALHMLPLMFGFKKRRFERFIRYVNGGQLDPDTGRDTIEFLIENARLGNLPIFAMPPRLGRRELEANQVPCSCYLGERDPLYNARKVKRRFDALGCAVRVQVLAGKGHFLDFDFDDLVFGALDASA